MYYLVAVALVVALPPLHLLPHQSLPPPPPLLFPLLHPPHQAAQVPVHHS